MAAVQPSYYGTGTARHKETLISRKRSHEILLSRLAWVCLSCGCCGFEPWLSSASDSIDQVEGENYQEDSSDNACDGLDEGSRVVRYYLINSYCSGPTTIGY